MILALRFARFGFVLSLARSLARTGPVGLRNDIVRQDSRQALTVSPQSAPPFNGPASSFYQPRCAAVSVTGTGAAPVGSDFVFRLNCSSDEDGEQTGLFSG